MKGHFFSPQIQVSTDLSGFSDLLKKLYNQQGLLQTIGYFEWDCAHISVYVQPMNSCEHLGQTHLSSIKFALSALLKCWK